MKELNEMTPIELNLLIKKISENKELVKLNIYKSLDEVDNLKEKINEDLDKIKNLEDSYVEIMAVLMTKQ